MMQNMNSSKESPYDRQNILEVRNFTLWFGRHQVLKNLNCAIKEKTVTAVIGPSGCGKSAFLRSINRTNDLIAGCKTSGEILFWGKDIYGKATNVYDLRQQVGMVAQRPNLFPTTIFGNESFGPKLNATYSKESLSQIVEECLKESFLWDRVKDRLGNPAMTLSGGQQQLLCIARALALKPRLLLMDDPCSALDPEETAAIESLIVRLKSQYTVILATHNLNQARRISDYSLFIYLGELMEFSETKTVFEHPKNELTKDYVEGKFG